GGRPGAGAAPGPRARAEPRLLRRRPVRRHARGGRRPPRRGDLRAAGWTVVEDEPALVLPQIPPLPPPPPGLEVRRVADASARTDFLRVLAAGFGAPTAEYDPNQLPAIADLDSSCSPLAAALDPDVAMLVGYFEGRPVSTAMMYKVDEI